MKKLLVLSFCILVMYAEFLQAQVTIGSAKEPITGALLQLKEDESSGANSTRGFGMPRVSLEKINWLSPAVPDHTAGNIDDGYTGLSVYNVFTGNGFCPGLYVWSGSEWQPLTPVEERPDIQMTDGDGNVYKAKWFTSDICDPTNGSYWATGNLYSTVDNTNTPFYTNDAVTGNANIPSKSAPKINTGYKEGTVTTGGTSGVFIRTAHISITKPEDLGTGPYTYPTLGDPTIKYGEATTEAGATNTSAEDTRLDFAIKFGLLYSYEQALRACPTGWHLPTQQEWEDLRTAMGGAAVAGDNMRTNYAYYYKAKDETTKRQWGTTVPAPEPSGFNALPSGMIGAQQDYAREFAWMSGWWIDKGVVSTGTIDNALILHNQKDLYIGNPPAGNLQQGYGNVNRGLSIRCVKDK